MKSFGITLNITSLSKAGTMQLRTIANEMHIKYSSKLQRDELIHAIIAKNNEYLKKQQLELF